ncbi:hypothetical protein EF847_01665 [Actinobacteria bacterium YIM 96077]|uniref:Uncharacterized protein n=2 Tax=Phytoactinopolyspora halophila TaxID=1981511 RepID=A0A329QFD7_9ACTN|nr:hypothetical protein EF847_01665 [Actinobacteria bacterium YIM 96077]RAW11173.1 hypothetical protein DPM12_17690 [Phytoactinopolyspora halophila]
MRAKRIKSGSRKGEPWFDTKINQFGATIWIRSHPRDTRWDIGGDIQDRLEPVPVCDGPGKGPQALTDAMARAV